MEKGKFLLSEIKQALDFIEKDKHSPDYIRFKINDRGTLEVSYRTLLEDAVTIFIYNESTQLKPKVQTTKQL